MIGALENMMVVAAVVLVGGALAVLAKLFGDDEGDE